MEALRTSVVVQLWIGLASFANGYTAYTLPGDRLVVEGPNGFLSAIYPSGDWRTCDVRTPDGLLVKSFRATTPARSLSPESVAAGDPRRI